jgi:hypothetical protein
MADQQVLIRYNIEQIFACQEANCLMIRELEKYCLHRTKIPKHVLADLAKPMDDVTRSYIQGANPNDMTLKNQIRDNLNKVNNANYQTIVDALKQLAYVSVNNFALLASEIMLKSMNDVMGCKGIEAKNGLKTPSEIYVSIAREFADITVMCEDAPICFMKVMSTEARVYFDRMTDKTESMDQNNPHRVSNYKGFMNMIGLMYIYGMFPHNTINVCLGKISGLMLGSGLKQDECDNYYSGAERLINRLLCWFETPSAGKKKEFDIVRHYIKTFNTKLSEACGDAVKKEDRPIRLFSVMTHQQNVARFETLCGVYDKIES